MLIKLLIITICGVAAYAVAARYGLDGSKGLLRDPLTIALMAMAVAYGVVRLTLGPLAGPLEWAQPVVEVKSSEDLNALVAAAGENPLLVDFYSPSCMPCRATAPALNTLAAEGHRVAVINVDEAHKLAWEYEVSAIPALLVFRNGKVARRAQGYHTAEGLRALIEGQGAHGPESSALRRGLRIQQHVNPGVAHSAANAGDAHKGRKGKLRLD